MVERLASARRRVDAVRSALLSSSPEELESSLPALEDAVACLRMVEHELRGGLMSKEETPGEAKGLKESVAHEAKALKDSLAIVQRVVTQGAAFYDGWLNVLGAAARGYTREGEPAPVAPVATVSIRG